MRIGKRSRFGLLFSIVIGLLFSGVALAGDLESLWAKAE